jgi:hypothetical protein
MKVSARTRMRPKGRHVVWNRDRTPTRPDNTCLMRFGGEGSSGGVLPLRGEGVGREDLEASPLPGKARGACVTGYPARGASREQVSTYYEEKLTGHGWEVKQTSEETQGSRDGLRYVVHYWRNPGSTEVEVQVFEG